MSLAHSVLAAVRLPAAVARRAARPLLAAFRLPAAVGLSLEREACR